MNCRKFDNEILLVNSIIGFGRCYKWVSIQIRLGKYRFLNTYNKSDPFACFIYFTFYDFISINSFLIILLVSITYESFPLLIFQCLFHSRSLFIFNPFILYKYQLQIQFKLILYHIILIAFIFQSMFYLLNYLFVYS